MAVDTQARADIVQLKATIAALQTQTTKDTDAITRLQRDLAALQASLPAPVPTPIGSTIQVRAGDDLQAALDQAKVGLQSGSVALRLAPGAVFTGNFVIRAAGQPLTNQLIIRSDAADGNFTPSGSRPWIDAGFAGAMPKFLSPNTSSSLTCEPGAHTIRLFGLDALPIPGWAAGTLWTFGSDQQTSLDQVPFDIAIDACYLHGDPTAGQRRGIAFQVRDGRITRSYFEKFIGADAQAWACWTGPGPFLCDSTYLEASGENVLIGGGDPKIPNLVPSDLTFRHCHFYKPLAWKTQFPGTVKNLFELKNARRVLLDGCLLENSWVDGQAGLGVVLTGRSQDCTAPWSTVDDFTMQYSVITGVEQAVQILGLDTRCSPSTRNTNVRFQHVLARAKSGFQIESGSIPTILQHVTLPSIATWFLQMYGVQIPAGQFTCQDSVLPSGLYGIAGGGSTTIGQATLDAQAPGSVFNANVIEQSNRGTYDITFPPGNVQVGPGVLAARLDARGRYTGPELGHDGVPVGADIDAILARIPWATW